jgi:hypothetical protein
LIKIDSQKIQIDDFSSGDAEKKLGRAEKRRKLIIDKNLQK